MMYLYIVLLIAIVFLIFRIFASKSNKPDNVSMKVYYRFQEHPGQYSGSLSAKHGALVFRGERDRDDINNIVVKDIRSTDAKIEIKLQQVLVLPFKHNENVTSEVSVRFRVASAKARRVDLTNYKVRINAVVSYKNGDKKAFSTTLPMMGVYTNEHASAPNQFKS
ncbi:hypothetical protein [Sphingobacterium sp.]|uniref:hypothetical protein n=1 Tax=Sphingobacterium sp. TaxID=341027 RepID=UPI0028A0ED85|nr:hypothetical protein [Sphingobacterium sp.]